MTAMQKRLFHGRTLTCQRCAKPFTVTEQTPDPVPAAPTHVPAPTAPPSAARDLEVEAPPSESKSQPLAAPKSEGGISARKMALLIALVGGVVMALLYFTVAPSVHRKRETGRRVICASNLSQIFNALSQYAVGNNGRFPDSLATIVADGSLPPELLVCPSSGDEVAPGKTPAEQAANVSGGSGSHNSYLYLGRGMTDSVSTRAIVYEVLDHHDGEGVNVLYTDGTTKFLPRAAALVALPQLGGLPPLPPPPAQTQTAPVR
jgi:hypothetical protein